MNNIFTFEKYTTFKNNIFHSTDLDSLYSILLNNRIDGITPQEINGKIVRGVSCTIDKYFVYKNKDVTLELNSSLKDKWKTYELDFFKTEFGKSRTIKHGLEIIDEKEIFVVTGELDKESYLKPLSKYLVSIRFNKKNIVIPEDIKEVIEMNHSTIRIYNYLNKDITKSIIKNKLIGVDLNFDSDLFDFN